MKKISYYKNGREMLVNDMPGSHEALTKDGWSTTPPEGWKESLPASEVKSELDKAGETIAKLESDLDFLIGAKKVSDDQLAELLEQVTQAGAKNAELTKYVIDADTKNARLVIENRELLKQLDELTAPPKDTKASKGK